MKKEELIIQLKVFLETIGPWFYDALKKEEEEIAQRIITSIQKCYEEYYSELKELSWKDLGLEKKKDQEDIPFYELVKIGNLMTKCWNWCQNNSLSKLSLSNSERLLLDLPIEEKKINGKYNFNFSFDPFIKKDESLSLKKKN